MRAQRLNTDTKTFTVEDVPIPEPGPGEVLVKVAFCGICHSDLSLINGTFPAFLPVVTQGHEASGTIAELGPGVTGWSEGDRVIVAAGRPCQRVFELPPRRPRQLPADPDHGVRLRRSVGRVHRGAGRRADPRARQRPPRAGRHPGRRRLDALRRGGAHGQGRCRRIGRGVGRRRYRHPHRATGPPGGGRADHRGGHQSRGARTRPGTRRRLRLRFARRRTGRLDHGDHRRPRARRGVRRRRPQGRRSSRRSTD